MFALEARGLSAAYGKATVLRDVDIKVAEGSIVSLIGPNGAGKTTMLTALMGLLKASGSVTYYGESLASLSVEDRVARGLCLVPERRELFGDMSIRDNLALGGFSQWLQRKGGRATALAEVFERFPRLRERHLQAANTLSGGERQMLALGRALMSRPKLLMLDEPSLGLAPLIVREIFRIIADLRSTGVSILLVEQNARAALEIADYAYVLESGAVTLQGSAQELAGNSRIIDTYLGRRKAEAVA
ncbi:ABC transporter ATP-binding protein [Microbacteriaceae bacterium K1510]|nr:ABC transporter ATP-binding protein [Microbacteriaceae bacterium K1510]